MKNLLIIIALVFFSCKDKEPQTNIESTAIAMSEIVNNTENIISETTSEKSSMNQNYIKSAVYKGTLNNNIKISMYLKEQKNPCGGDLTFFIGMYKYVTQDKWILLDITTDRQKKNYCMVEDGFTGVLFLEDNESSLYGNWISTDTKKQFKVELENQFLDLKYAKDHDIIEQLDEILFDELIYEKNDC